MEEGERKHLLCHKVVCVTAAHTNINSIETVQFSNNAIHNMRNKDLDPIMRIEEMTVVNRDRFELKNSRQEAISYT